MQQILPLASLGQDDKVPSLGQDDRESRSFDSALDDKTPVPDTYIMSGTGGTTVSIRKFPRG